MAFAQPPQTISQLVRTKYDVEEWLPSLTVVAGCYSYLALINCFPR
jgi:hypothetical protein